MKKIISLALLFVTSLSLAACAQNSGKSSGKFTVEEAITLNIYDENRKIGVETDGANQSVTYSTDSDVITVLNDGTVIANKFGTATVTVTCGTQKKTCTVTVRETDAIPTVAFAGVVGNQIDLIAGDTFALDYSATVENCSINAEYSFETSDTGVFQVSGDGVLTAVSTGEAYLTVNCEYKVWDVEQVFAISVTTDTVVKLSQNKLSLCPITGVPETDTFKKIDFLGVFEDGEAVDGATVTWESMDESVATVEDGVITAVNLGKTYVKATYTNGEKSVSAYVLVTVAYPSLQMPANFRLEGDTLVWDSVVAADGYIVYDGTNEVKTSETSLKLSDLNPANNYFAHQRFYVSAFSNVEGFEDSKSAVCEEEFETLSYTDRIVKPQDSYEAAIKQYTGMDFIADVPIYHATCTGTAIPGKPEIYGYLFRKVYYTQKASDVYGTTGSHGNWLNTSLLNPAKVSNFYDSKITFWAYAEQETTIYYVKMNQNWERTIIGSKTLPADTWTNVAFSISKNDFPYITMISSTGDFYFTDFRISTLTYTSNDYSDIDKSVERAANIVAAIDELPNASQVPTTTEFGDTLKAIRGEYETLSDRRKKDVSNYEKFVAVEKAFGLAVYSEVQSDAAVTALIAKFDEYNASYKGVSMDNFNSFETKATAIETAINALNSKQYYGVIYANTNYAAYAETRKAYKLINIATSNVKEMVDKSSALSASSNGWVEINNMLTAPNVASALKHPTYGYVATMGTNPRENTVITFKTKNSWKLDGYTHLMFAVKNPRNELMSVHLYENGGRVKTLAAGIAKAENYAPYATVIVSIEDFMKYDISFGYDGMPQGTGSIWLTQLIAIKVDDSAMDEVNELQEMLDGLKGEITLASGEALAAARTLYDSLTSEQKAFITDISPLTDGEARFAVLVVEDKISKIGRVEATAECLEKIQAARNAYDALDRELQAKVSNYATLTEAEETIRAMAEPDETAKAVIENIQAFLNGFVGVSPANVFTVQAQIAALDEEIAGLTVIQKYSLKNYEAYVEAKTSFLLIDDLKGTDIASRFKLGSGSTGINNGETAPNVASALIDPTYGACATIGKSAQGLDIKYAATTGLDLSGYTHVIFAMRNRMSVVINFRNSTTGAYYADNVAVGEWVLIKMTVKEFVENGVSVWVSGSGSIWLSSIVAVKIDATYEAAIQEYNALIAEILSGEITEETAEKVETAKALYAELPGSQKIFATDIGVLAEVEAVLSVIALIDDLGEITATIECAEKIAAVRDAFNLLSPECQEKVYNKQLLTEAESEIKEVMDSPEAQAVKADIQAFLNDFSGFTMENRLSLQAQVAALDEKIAALSTLQLYAVTNYEDYLAKKSTFKVIDELRDGTVAELKAKFTWGGYNGYSSINNGVTAPNVASALKDPTYGDMVTIGKNANAIGFKYVSDNLDLTGYTHVTFVFKNSSLTAAVSLVTSKNKRLLAENVAVGAYATVKMTVEEFKNETVILFTPDNRTESGATGSFWISAFVAVQVNATQEIDAELASFVSGFPAEITVANYRAQQSKVETIESMLSSLTEAQKAQLTNLAAYTEKKNSFKLIDDLKGLDIASRFKFSNANGINNGETAPNVANALIDSTYGPCATIGKQVGGLEISYAATADLDLSGYTYVTFAVKNNLSVAFKAQNRVSGAYLSEEIASGSFGIVKMTVKEFMESGVAFWVSGEGTVWISSIIAVK